MEVNAKKISATARDVLHRREHGTGIHRLVMYVPTRKIHLDYESLAHYINTELPSGQIFVADTCFLSVRHEMPRSLWDALLQKRVVLTARVLDELADWKGSHGAGK